MDASSRSPRSPVRKATPMPPTIRRPRPACSPSPSRSTKSSLASISPSTASRPPPPKPRSSIRSRSNISTSCCRRSRGTVSSWWKKWPPWWPGWHRRKIPSPPAPYSTSPGDARPIERPRATLVCTARPPCEPRARRRLFVQPDVEEILPDEVAGRQIPAFNFLIVDDDALIPKQRHVVGAGQRITLEVVHDFEALLAIDDLRLQLEEIVELGVTVAGVGNAGGMLAQQRVELGGGIVGEVGNVLHDRIELAVLHGGKPQLGLDWDVLRFHADTPPLIDGIYAGRNERLIDRSIHELDFQIRVPCLLQQAPGFGT